jgi:hypothetical protein
MMRRFLMTLSLVLVATLISYWSFAGEHNEHKPFTITLMDYPGALERYGPPLKKAYETLGISVDFIKLGHGYSIDDTNKGRFDAELMRAAGVEKKYPNLIPVGEPLLTANIVVLCQQDLPCDNKLLASSTIEVHSVMGATLWNKAINNTQATVKYQKSLATLKQLFIDKKIAYMVFSLDKAGVFTAKSLNAQVMDKPLLTVNTHHFIHKKHLAIIDDLAKAINYEFQKLNEY